MKYVRINITLTPEDIERLQNLEKETGKSRSELIREAVRAYRPQKKKELDRTAVLNLLDTVRVDFPVDPVTMIRGMREGRRSW